MVDTPNTSTKKWLAVLDLETSGLNVKTLWVGDHSRLRREHTPGTDPDCILEVGLVLLDAETLEEKFKRSWLVLPPNVTSKDQFDAWCEILKEKNRFVFDLHTQGAKEEDVIDGGPFKLRRDSLLGALRGKLGSTMSEAYPYEFVMHLIISVLYKECGCTGKTHPGNSNIVMCGNSIANLDIPMLVMWMPQLHQLLSYRIMDVSVLRQFYQDLARVPLPEGLAEAIKSGGGGHRALSDALYCADALRGLVKHAQRPGAVGDGL